MECPNCNSVLITIERNGVEVEYCTECKGFWLNVDEWELIKQALNIQNKTDDIMLSNDCVKADTNERPKNCPVCFERMEKINVSGVVLDRCLSRHGVWFDKDELSKYINSGNDTNTDNTVYFLGEFFKN